MSMVLGRPVGAAHPPFIVAAIDCGGLTQIEAVLAAIDAAADAGCDGLKLVTLPWTWYPALFERAERRGLVVLASVEDGAAVTRLDWLGASAFELFLDWADLDLITVAARTRKPLVLSIANTPAARVAEVVAHARREGAPSVAVLQRVAGHPLGRIDRPLDTSIADFEGAVRGVSYRPTELAIARSAITRGARIVEVRLSPARLSELAQVVEDGANAWALLGHARDRWTTN